MFEHLQQQVLKVQPVINTNVAYVAPKPVV